MQEKPKKEKRQNDQDQNMHSNANLIESKTIQYDVIKGNLGQDPILKTIEIDGNERKVSVFSIALNIDDEVNWVNCQAWDKKIDKTGVNELKKGDFVKLEGHYGKEYRVKTGEIRKDFNVESCQLLKKATKTN